MNTKKIHHFPVVATILAGGSGSRLWPLSTRKRPKQLLTINHQQNLLESTIERVASLVNDNWSITTSRHQQELLVLYQDKLLIEPASKNTAPAILLSALYWAQHYPDAIFCSFPADHTVNNVTTWQQSINSALNYAHSNNQPVLLGVKPESPAPWYGYISYSEITTNTFSITSFIEKPNVAHATQLLQTGNVLWNSGILMSPVATLINAFKEWHPSIFEAADVFLKTGDDTLYQQLTPLSIDHALLEKQFCTTMMPLEGGWSDIGNFDTFHAAQQLEANPVQKIEINASNNITISNKQIVLVDVDNLQVIETDNVILIMKKNATRTMHDVMHHLKTQGLEHLL